MRIERVGKACAKIAEIGEGRIWAVALYVGVADKERGVVFQLADVGLCLLQGGNGGWILGVEIVRVADGKPSQCSCLGAGVGMRVILHSGVSRWSAEFHQLPRHGPQIAGSDEGALHLVRAGCCDLLARTMSASRRRRRFLVRCGRGFVRSAGLLRGRSLAGGR